MKIIYFFVALFSSQLITAQDITLKKGAVNEGLFTADSLHIPYSVFIPLAYESEKLSKVLFIFDPKGEALKAIRYFLSGNTVRDFIIVASEKPITGSITLSINEGVNLIGDVFNKFAIDGAQVYTTGLNEGAQVASGLAYTIANISGVLCINDIYISDYKDLLKQKELFIGMVSEGSSNYYKMEDSFDRLKWVNKRAELYEYKGDSNWPNLDYINTALHLLYTNNMERLDKTLDPESIEIAYKADMVTVEKLISNKSYQQAFDLLKSLKGRYDNKDQKKGIKDQIKTLRKNNDFKRLASIKDKIEENTLRDEISLYLGDDVYNANYDNLGYWDERILEFRTIAKDSTKPKESKIARRMLGLIKNDLLFYEKDLFEAPRSSIDQKIYVNVLKTIVEPDNYLAYQRIIALSTLDKDENTAFFYLEELLKTGFDNYDALYAIPLTEVLQKNSVYNAIIRKYLGKSKY